MLKELPTAYSYNSGLMLVFMSGMFVKLRFVYASSSSLLLLVIYNLIVSANIRDPQLILINNNFFLISANIIGLFLTYYFEKYQRKMFLNTRNLNQQKKELERANQLLEFKVKRRTESLLQKNKELMERIQKEDGNNEGEDIEKEEINEMKTKYLVKIGREIRTPLNAVSGFSELITAPDIEDENRLIYGSLLSKSVRQLFSISREIQVVAYLEENHGRDHFEAIPLHYFMLEIKDRVLDYFLEMESIFIEEPKFKVLSIYQNKVKLSLLIEKLMEKVVLNTHLKQINLGYRVEGNYISFYIKYDSSTEQLFRSTENKNKSNGVVDNFDSVLMNTLADNIGGIIHYHDLGGGMEEIVVRLPYQEGNISMEELVPEINKAKSLNPQLIFSGSLQSILIAEDDDLNFNFYNIVLSKYYRVFRARNGAEAVDLFIKNNPNIILMDIQMPIMGGIEASNQIKSLSLNTPIIALTAFESENTDEFNFTDFMIKPVPVNELLLKVRKYLAPPT